MGLVFSCGVRSFGRARAESYYSDAYMPSGPFVPSVSVGLPRAASSHDLMGTMASAANPGGARARGGAPSVVRATAATATLVEVRNDTLVRRPGSAPPVAPERGPGGTAVFYGTVPWNKFRDTSAPDPIPPFNLPTIPPPAPITAADAGDATVDASSLADSTCQETP